VLESLELSDWAVVHLSHGSLGKMSAQMSILTALVSPLIADLSLKERCALHQLLSVMAWGERVAMEGATLQASIVTDSAARVFLRRQARHERFHALIFETAVAVLEHDPKLAATCHVSSGEIPVVLHNWRGRIRRAIAQNRLAESLLVQQVFLEGLGHIILREIDAACFTGGRQIIRMRETILRQEAQHHEFGLRLLQSELERSPAMVLQLEEMGQELFAEAETLLSELSDSFAVLDAPGRNFVAELRAELPLYVSGLAA
jgi:hypothetical protein